MRLARTPIPPPAPAEQQPEAPSHIIVRHPHYDSSHNVLLRLLAVDTQGGAGGHGLCAQFVLDACAVVAGNRWDGWLSETADATAAAVDASSILAKPSYYFHLAGERPYAIVPSFREWRFPHGDLPIHWTTAIPADDRPTHRSYAASNLTTALQQREASCRFILSPSPLAYYLTPWQMHLLSHSLLSQLCLWLYIYIFTTLPMNQKHQCSPSPSHASPAHAGPAYTHTLLSLTPNHPIEANEVPS